MRQGSSNGQKNPTKHSIVPAPKQISVEANHRTRASQCTVLARLATGSTHRRRPNREAAASAAAAAQCNERMPSETGGVGVRIIVRIDTVRRTELRKCDGDRPTRTSHFLITTFATIPLPYSVPESHSAHSPRSHSTYVPERAVLFVERDKKAREIPSFLLENLSAVPPRRPHIPLVPVF